MDEQLKKELIAQAGTFPISASILTNSREVKAEDIVEVPWTAKQTVEYDQNK
jgi:hypothetical protein